MRKLLIAGNWKMYKDRGEAIALAEGILECSSVGDSIDIAVFPPAVFIKEVADILRGSGVAVGAQNMHAEEEGAFTGEISSKMVLTTGGIMVILGHSERRNVFGEPNDFIRSKVKKAMTDNLMPVLCIGEKLEEREANRTEAVLNEQLDGSLRGISVKDADSIVLAYEPVWAIGTGVNATPEQAQGAHAFIRSWLRERYGDIADKLRILYGGSVKPANAEVLLLQPDVDGALIGGASLKAESFCEIISIAKTITNEAKW